MRFEDKPREACGIFGIHGHPDASRLTYFGLYALQHRGQESAGIAVLQNGDIASHKGMGIVPDVFDLQHMEQLHQDPALVGDGERARNAERVRERVQVMLREMEQAHHVLRTLVET